MTESDKSIEEFLKDTQSENPKPMKFIKQIKKAHDPILSEIKNVLDLQTFANDGGVSFVMNSIRGEYHINMYYDNKKAKMSVEFFTPFEITELDDIVVMFICYVVHCEK